MIAAGRLAVFVNIGITSCIVYCAYRRALQIVMLVCLNKVRRIDWPKYAIKIMAKYVVWAW